MELIRISEGKLKIMLTPPDMEKYHLNCDELDCTSEDTREAFRHLFDDACAEVNFKTEGERLFIQLYTSRGGGCEIFVTKIESPLTNTNAQSESNTLTPPERALIERIVESVDSEKQSNNLGKQDNRMNISAREKELPHSTVRICPHVFAFDGIAPLISVCRRLQSIKTECESRAYIDKSNVSFLVLYLPAGGYYRLSDKLAFIMEYGRRIMSEGADARLEEYADPICVDNAIEVLSKC